MMRLPARGKGGVIVHSLAVGYGMRCDDSVPGRKVGHCHSLAVGCEIVLRLLGGNNRALSLTYCWSWNAAS